MPKGAPRATGGQPQDRDDPAADPREVAREIALRLLTVKSRTRAELLAGLAKRGVPDAVASDVVERFEELKLVDDAEYARAWAQGQQRRMKSARVLKQELRRKGVDDEILDDTFASVDADDDYAAAYALARKKLRTLASLEPQVRDRRLAGALARRGFAPDVCWRAMKDALAAYEADAALSD